MLYHNPKWNASLFPKLFSYITENTEPDKENTEKDKERIRGIAEEYSFPQYPEKAAVFIRVGRDLSRLIIRDNFQAFY